MRVAAISDFHIGADARRDGFRHDLRTFERWLTRLEAEHDRIVLLGDIFQTDHELATGPVAATRSLRAAQRRLGSLWDRMSSDPYVYVHGNHDLVAAGACAAGERHVAEGRVSVLFVHGHQFDPVARRAPALADLGTYGCGRLRAVGLRRVAQWLEGRDVAIKHERFGGPEGPYARGARELAGEHGTPIVVMGHTHVAGITPFDGGAYVNTGTCSNGARQCVSVDTETGRVEVRRGDDAPVLAFMVDEPIIDFETPR